MKIHIKNLGAIRYAEIEMGKFTIICGMNNSGKTYATYAIYGFLHFWRNEFNIPIEKSIIKRLKDNGVFNIPLKDYIKNAQEIINQSCDEYTKILPSVYSAQEKLFDHSSFKITVDACEIKPSEDKFSNGIKTSNTKSEVLTLHRDEKNMELTVTLFSENTEEEIPNFIISHTLSDAIKEIVFCHVFPNIFIASAERTGAAIFRQELNFARNRMLDQISKKDGRISPFELLRQQKSDYALPVEHNVEFARKLESMSKNESYLVKNHKDVIDAFTNVLGGDYQVTKNNELFFSPSINGVKLTMDESSSAVRSLLDIGFYLKHVAQKGDLLMIDEPELNLHPENQRNIARLLASLINCGLNIFVTTHSDYILRELSNLILLNRQSPHIVELIEREGYRQTELIKATDIKLYIAKEDIVRVPENKRGSKIQTLVETNVDEESGIQTSCFDDTIDAMNRIQDEIIFGG